MSETHVDLDTELIDQEQGAQNFEIPDRPLPAAPLGMFGGSSSRSYGGSANDGHQRPTDIKSLEDLYAVYPRLGAGDWKIRVERTRPISFRGCSTAGFLGEFYERYSLQEFSEKWGGGTYNITVMQPVGNGDTVTRSDYRTVKTLRVVIPGDPSLIEGIPSDKDDGMAQAQHTLYSGRPSEAVEIEKIRTEREIRTREHTERIEAQKRLEKERERNNQLPDHLQQAFITTQKRTLDEFKDMSGAQLSFWQEEVHRLRGELTMSKRDMDELQKKLTQAQSEAANVNRQIETSSMRDMKERYEERLAEIKDRYEDERRRREDDYSSKLSTLASDHRRVVEEMGSRHSEERRNYEAAQMLERERTREDTRARVADVERQKEQEVSNLKSTYEARIADLTRTQERELGSLRDTTRREIDTIRVSEQANATVSKESAGARAMILEGELNRLRTQTTQLEAENRDLRDKNQAIVLGQVKNPLTALRESKEMAMEFGGLVDASEAASDKDWKQTGLNIVERLAENIPEILKDVRSGRQAAAQQAATAAQQRVVVSPQQPPQQQRQIAPQPQQQQRYAPPPMGMPQQQQASNYTPPPMGTAVSSMPNYAVPIGPAVVVVPSPIQPGGASADYTVAPMVGGDDGPSGDDGGDDGSVSQGPVSFGSDAPVGAPPPLEIQPDHATTFFIELEKAYGGGVPSSLFAAGFIERVGRDNAHGFLQQMTPDQVVEMARRATNGEARVVTREGQKYVREMFGHVARLLQQQG